MPAALAECYPAALKLFLHLTLLRSDRAAAGAILDTDQMPAMEPPVRLSAALFRLPLLAVVVVLAEVLADVAMLETLGAAAAAVVILPAEQQPPDRVITAAPAPLPPRGPAEGEPARPAGTSAVL